MSPVLLMAGAWLFALMAGAGLVTLANKARAAHHRGRARLARYDERRAFSEALNRHRRASGAPKRATTGHVRILGKW